MVLCHKVFCGVSTSDNYDISTDLNRTMLISMPECEWPWLGSRPVHWDQLSRVCMKSSDEENSVLRCCGAVLLPPDCCVLQMLPRPVSVDLTGVQVAGNQAAGDEVHRWEVHPPWIVLEDAAPILWISCRPKLNRFRCTI